MRKEIEQFMQVPDCIPFRKITHFNVLSVRSANDQYEIKLDRKCEGWQIQKQYVIVRKISDFRWVLKQLQIQSPWLIVLPSLMQSNWSIMDVIGSSNQIKTNLKKWSNQCYQSKIIYRFLKILSQISLKNLYKMPGFIQSSLFSFLDKSYELYKLDKYQQNNVKQPTTSNNNKLSQLAHSIGKGSLKILGMLNIIKQQQNNKYLSQQTNKLQHIKKQLQNLNTQFDKLQKSLQLLSQNFLNQQKSIKVKQQKIYEVHLKILDLFRISTQISNQANQVLRKHKIYEDKNDDKINIKDQIAQYQKYIDAEIVQIQLDVQKTLKQAYKQCYEQNVQIRIINLYPCRT